MSRNILFQECKSDQCKNINSQIPMIELPPGFELFSLAILSQILSRPDQNIFGPSSYFSNNLFELLFGNAKTFDVCSTFWTLFEKYGDPIENAQIYEYSDFTENAVNNIFDLEYNRSKSIKKALLEQVFNRQFLRFYGVDRKEKIIDKIRPPLAQNTIFYAKSLYMKKDIPEAICIKKNDQKTSSFTPALEHVWTIYRENNKFSLHIRFFNSIYIPYRPSNEALPVAICYYPNTFIKLIAKKFKKGKNNINQNIISFPNTFNSNSIEKLLNTLYNYLNTSEYINLKQKDALNFIKLVNLSALNSSIFANYFLEKKVQLAIYFAVISIYPKAEWKKVRMFLNSQVKEYEYKSVKDQYTKFVLWIMHAITILREKEKAQLQSALGLLTTTIPGNHAMINFTFGLYSYYYKCLEKINNTDANKLLVEVCAIGNSVFEDNVFYYMKNGKKIYDIDQNIRFDYGFDSLPKLYFTIPELLNDFNLLYDEFCLFNHNSILDNVKFSIDIEFIKSILVPDVFSLISTAYKEV